MTLVKFCHQTEKIFTIVLILILTEGILRKWMIYSPAVSNIFMVARDPFLLWVVVKGFQYRVIKNVHLKGLMIISIITFITTFISGHQNIIVAIFGARLAFIYFPAIFVFGKTLSYEYVCKCGRFFLYLFPFMVALIIAQFFSPASSFINAKLNGVGRDLDGASYEYQFKAMGIFMSITGLVSYFMMSISFLILYYVHPPQLKQQIKSVTFFICLLALVASYPFAVSRTYIFFSCTAFLLYLRVLDKKNIKRLFSVGIVLGIVLLILSTNDSFDIAVSTMTARYEGATNSEGKGAGTLYVIYYRSIGWVFDLMETYGNEIPFFGYGDGSITNVGAQLLSITKTDILHKVGDNEWASILAEKGFFFGLIYLILRIMMGVEILKKAFILRRYGYVEPILFAPFPVISLFFMPLRAPQVVGLVFVACTFEWAMIYNAQRQIRLRKRIHS